MISKKFVLKKIMNKKIFPLSLNFSFFTDSIITTNFHSKLTKNFHQQLVYMKMNESQTGVALLKGVNFSFINTRFSLWMNGYR